MRLQDDIDFTTLTWVKAELDETLKQARHALEAYVEDPADASQMRFCATYLHQVQGTLRMVELYGAAMVTEEMEHLASALLDNDIKDRDEAYAVLMRGIVQLPDYLERLQTGHKDIPIVLLPLLNDLRGARGEKGLSEIVLFTPDLSRPLPLSAKGPLASLPELELRQIAEQLRGQFQLALLNWFRNVDADNNVTRISQVCDKLVAIVSQEEARRLFWVAAGVLEALRAKAFEPSPQLKQTIGKVEREIKRLADAGENSFRVDPPRELTRNLLYFVAHAPTEHGRIGELRQVFRLDNLLPTEAEIAHARGSMSGHNRALLDTVSVAIKEDLMRVKDALDFYLRTQNASPAALGPQVEVLDRVSDTLGMLGLGVARRVVQEQRTAVHQVATGVRVADEAALLDIAGALLYVEASLDDQVQHLGGGAAEDVSGRPLPQAEARKVLEVLVKEAQANFAQAKQCFVAFVESNWDHAQLQDVPRLLEEVSGAMRILELAEPPQFLLAIRRFTEAELLARRRVPNGQQMDTLADALASLEYYLEAVREHRAGRDKILEVTRNSLETLGYWPVPDAIDVMPAATVDEAAPAAPASPAAAAPSPTRPVDPVPAATAPPASAPPVAPPQVDAAPASPSVATPAPVAAAAPAPAVAAPPPETRGDALVGFEGNSDEIDEEIREVFIEEVQEEISNLGEQLPLWRNDPHNVDNLKPIRRVFHTLKGSGRLVGALTLGEFAWKIENMLNRVLDKTIQPTAAVQAIVGNAHEMLPQLLAALRGERGVHADVEGIKAVAERLTAGEQAWYEAPAALAPVAPTEPEIAAEPVVEPEAMHTEIEPEVVIATLPEAVPEAAAQAEPEPEFHRISIDPVLFDILKAEVAGHLETVDEYLDAANAAPKPATDALLRAVHTMNGAFAMTDVPVITEVIGPLEGYIKRVLAQGGIPSATGLAVIHDSSEAVRSLMLELEEARPRLPDLSSLAARIVAERDALPEPVGPSVPLHLDAMDDDEVGLTEAVSIDAAHAEPAIEATTAIATPAPIVAEADAAEAAAPVSAVTTLAPSEAAVSADALVDAFIESPGEVPALAPTDRDTFALEDVTDQAFGADDVAEHALSDTSSLDAFDFTPSEATRPSVDATDAASQRVDATLADAWIPEEAASEREAVAASTLPTDDFRFEFDERALGDELIFDLGDDTAEPAPERGFDVVAPAPASESAFEEPAVKVPELSEPYAEPVSMFDPSPTRADPTQATAAEADVAGAEFDELHIDSVRAAEPLADTRPAEIATSLDDESAFEVELLALGDLEVGTDAPLEFEILEADELDGGMDLGLAPDAPRAAAPDVEATTPVAARFEQIDAGAAATAADEAASLEAMIAAYEAAPDAPREADSTAADIAAEADAQAFLSAVTAEDRDAVAGFDAIGSGFDLDARPVTVDADRDEAFAFDATGFDQPDATRPSIDVDADEREAAAALDAQRIAELDATRAETEAAQAAAEAAATEAAELEELAAQIAELEAAEAAAAEAARLAADTAAREAAELAELEARIAELEAAESAAAAAAAAAEAEALRATAPADADADSFAAHDARVPQAASMLPSEPLADFAAEARVDAAAAAAEAEADGGARVRFATLADADPDPDAALELADMDEDLLDIFLEESGDILDHSDGLMARLRETPTDRELVVGLQRDLHTLKGGARMAGIAPIGDLGHAMEFLLEAVAEGKRELAGPGVETLERCFDRLHSMVTRVGQRRALAMPVTLIDRVEALGRGETLKPYVVPGETTAEAAATPDPAREEAPTPVAASPVASASSPQAPLSEPMVDEDDISVRAPQEQIRIRADLLDRLVNYAGEVAIYRARLEQQLGLFRGNLGELDQTTTRLREQLRKLEIETEAQIVARYQREAEVGESAFDPLELDRFSTLQQLSRALSESAADIVNLQTTLEDHTRQYETLLLQQSRVSSELQEGLMRTRMVPFDSLVPRLRRIIRQTAGELGKKAQLKVEGAQGEMDRNVLDRMTAPLEHMLRNALAHGLETPADRLAAGKPEEGTVRIAVRREGSEVVIVVSDDGRGLDRDAIRRKALERGLMKPDAQLSDRDLYGFILETGFSTAETVSKIAGRGVGMDVVHSEIRQLGGSLYIESERGRGSEFVVRLPFTLAVTQAVFVKHGDTSFAVPISSVQGVARIDRATLEEQLASDAPSFRYAGEDYAIYDLGLLLGQSHVRAEESLQVPLLLARSGDQRAAICVDQVIGSREIVVKPVGPQVSSIPGIFGATIMGDGRVIVILDFAPLVRRSAAMRKTGDAPIIAVPIEQRRIPLVMVVDDSITMRKVTGRVLERHNYEVITAKDGVDAIEKLQERIPDVMLLDIEMPRMDGYELATHMRNDGRLRGIPIIMITSRTGEKHRQRAFEIGVDRYLGKPYQENELMRNVHEILKVGRGGAG